MNLEGISPLFIVTDKGSQRPSNVLTGKEKDWDYGDVVSWVKHKLRVNKLGRWFESSHPLKGDHPLKGEYPFKNLLDGVGFQV